jgi:hypothetical protein
MSAPAQEVAEPAAAADGPRRSLTALRVIATVHSLAAIVQPMLAGIYLSGDVDAIRVHEINGSIVGGLGIAQLIAAIVFRWKGKGRGWPLHATAVILLAEIVQINLGYLALIAVHLPLGVTIISMQILTTVWLFRADAGRPHQPKERVA